MKWVEGIEGGFARKGEITGLGSREVAIKHVSLVQLLFLVFIIWMDVNLLFQVWHSLVVAWI